MDCNTWLTTVVSCHRCAFPNWPTRSTVIAQLRVSADIGVVPICAAVAHIRQKASALLDVLTDHTDVDSITANSTLHAFSDICSCITLRTLSDMVPWCVVLLCMLLPSNRPTILVAIVCIFFVFRMRFVDCLRCFNNTGSFSGSAQPP